MSFGRRPSSQPADQKPSKRSTGSTDYSPAMQEIAASMQSERKPGLSLATQWMIVGPLIAGILLTLIVYRARDIDPVEVAAVGQKKQPWSQTMRNAFAVCSWIDSSGVTSAPCQIDGLAVVATVHLSVGEARVVCSKLAQKVRDSDMRFEGDWKLKIASPYSAGNSIAFCDLPSL